MLRLASAEALRIRQHAENGYPHEVVGILAGDAASATVTRVAHLVNERSTEARTRYRVSGLMVMRAEQALEAEGLQVLGYYHSHPDHPSRYSEYDRDHALPNLSYLIVSVRDGASGDMQSWRLRDDRSAMDEETIHLVQREELDLCRPS